MTAEVLDDSPDDTRIVIRILEKRRDRGAASEEQAVVAGEPEVRIHQFRVPALHLLAGGKQDLKLPVGQWFGHAEKRLCVEGLVGQRTDRRAQLVDRNDDVVCGHAAGMRMRRVILESLHLSTFEHLHAVLDQQVLHRLQAQQRVDPVGAAVTYPRRVLLRSEYLWQLSCVVRALIGEADAFATLPLRRNRLLAARAETEEQGILP